MRLLTLSGRIQALLLSVAVGLALAAAALLALPAARTLAAPDAASFNYPGGAPCDTTLQACIDGAAAGDSIHILAGTYTQSFTLNKAVSLIGAGAASTRLVAPPNSRVFTVTAGMTSSTVISGLLVTGGNITDASGGGILLDSLTITPAEPLLVNMVISGNRAQAGGGIAWFHTAQVLNSVFISNAASYGGGGLFSFGAAVSGSQFIRNSGVTGAGGISTKAGSALTNTDFISNNATLAAGAVDGYGVDIIGGSFRGNHTDADGGAVAASGPSTVSGTSFSGNSAGGNGGAIAIGAFASLTLRDSTLSGNHAGEGGGLRNEGALTVSNSTLSANSADSGGGLSNYLGQARLSFVTLSGNSAITGGGLNQFALLPGQTITLAATLLADSPSGGNCATDGLIAIVSNNHNLSTDAACAAALTQPQDQNDTPALLGALAANGGPTLTHLPASTSPAIDAAGTAGCPAADQRGVARPHPAAGSCDIGAVEVNVYKVYVPLAINTAPVFITYRNFEIVPASNHIKVGTTVTFLIEDSVHQPYSFSPPYNFDSPANMGPGSMISFDFNLPGTITLQCGYHAIMTATLVIEP